MEELLRLGADMLPGVKFAIGMPGETVDLAVALGDTPILVNAERCVRINAGAWTGYISREDQGQRWNHTPWPFGALAAAGLAAGEAFKAAMHKLLPYCIVPDNTAQVFKNTDEVSFALAPEDAPNCRDLGKIDFISAGAITNSALFSLMRIPSVRGCGRIVEPDLYEIGNLNRYPLLRRSHLGRWKGVDLSNQVSRYFQLTPHMERFDEGSRKLLSPIAPVSFVGVDDIPTRWEVQRAEPEWLVIGATTHWSALASFHRDGLGCAQCLHPYDDPGNAPIPTTACVSFWAGLLAASYLVRYVAGDVMPANEQQVYMTAFRPETPFRSPVPTRPTCPTCQAISSAA